MSNFRSDAARRRPAPVVNAENERVGATLAQFRMMRGFSQESFGTELGISRPYISLIEKGRKRLTNELLDRAADLLEVNPLAIKRRDADVKDIAA